MAGLKSRDFAILQVQRAGAGGGVRCSVECFEALGGCLPGRSTGCALRSLSRSGSFIRDLSISLRSGPQRDPRFRTSEDRGFDLQATAFLQGISVFELERRLRGRRRQTARIAYATFALGCIFLMAWVCEALSSMDSRACHYGAGIFAVLRSFLFARILQCAAKLPDADRPRRELARVSGDERAVLAGSYRGPQC
jgi:hypothetical protein